MRVRAASVPRISTAAAALMLVMASASCAFAAPSVVWTWDRGPAWVRDFPRPRDESHADSIRALSGWPGLAGGSPEFALHASQIDDADEAPWRDHEGDPVPRGAHATIEAGGTARAGSWAELALRPRAGVSGDALAVTWLEARLSLRAGAARLDAGRTRLWLSPARHGSLLLSNNAHPLDLVHLSIGGRTTNSIPILSLLRAVRGGAAVAWLDDDAREFPDPNLGALYVRTQWSSWLEISLQRTMLFAGEGHEFDWGDLGDIIFAGGGENSLDPDENLSDQIASIAFTARLDRLLGSWGEALRDADGGVLGFYEYAGDDNLRDWLPRNPGVAGGLTVWRGGWEFHGELAQNRNKNARWYSHSVYTSGYTYRGVILGHHMGWDAYDLAFSLAAPAGGDDRRVRAFVERKAALYSEREDPAAEWTVALSAENLWRRDRFALSADLITRWGDSWPADRLGAIETKRASLRWSWML
jgi:hypothetical protein